MNKNETLESIIEKHGLTSLDVSDKNFYDETIFGKFFQCSFFHKVNFINCYFDECHLLDVGFDCSVFQNCTFNKTTLRKLDIDNCTFKNCQFIECALTPKTSFFDTSFINSQFSSVDFSQGLFKNCEFLETRLTRIKFDYTTIINPKIRNSTFNDFNTLTVNNLTFFKNDSTASTVDSIIINLTNSVSLPKLDLD
jgi:uncharacterized protein YjbI with pentapeptide repeats